VTSRISNRQKTNCLCRSTTRGWWGNPSSAKASEEKAALWGFKGNIHIWYMHTRRDSCGHFYPVQGAQEGAFHKLLKKKTVISFYDKYTWSRGQWRDSPFSKGTERANYTMGQRALTIFQWNYSRQQKHAYILVHIYISRRGRRGNCSMLKRRWMVAWLCMRTQGAEVGTLFYIQRGGRGVKRAKKRVGELPITKGGADAGAASQSAQLLQGWWCRGNYLSTY